MEDSRFFKISLAIILLFVLGVVLKLAKIFLFPFFLAVFISYLLDPPLMFLMKRRVPKIAAIALVLVFAFVLLYLLGALLYSSGKSFAAGFPGYEARIQGIVDRIGGWLGRLPFDSPLAFSLEKIDFGKAATFVLSALGPFFRFVSRLLLVFLFLVFIFSGRGRLQAKLQTSLGLGGERKIHSILQAINRQIREYLAIKTVLSLINGLQVWLVLTVFGVDFALFFGFLAFLLNYIPNFGSFFAALLRVGFALFQFGTIWIPLWILVITVGLDTITGSIVEPRIMGRRLGLSPLLILFSLLFWGWLWGIPGMILAVPTIAIIKIVCQNIPAFQALAILME